MDAKEAEVDGTRPRPSEHPAPAAIDAWRARYATQPWKKSKQGRTTSAADFSRPDPRWEAPRSQTWQGYRPSSEVLSNTSEQWFPPDAFADPADESTPQARTGDSVQARHRASRRPTPNRRGAGRWARQLVVLLPLALASSSWATLADTEAPEGGWFPKDDYRMALGGETTDTTMTVESAVPTVETQSTSKPIDRSEAAKERKAGSHRAERSAPEQAAPVAEPEPEPVRSTEPEAPAEPAPAPEPAPSKTAAPEPTTAPEPPAQPAPPPEEEPEEGGGLLPLPLPILGDLPLLGGLLGTSSGAASSATGLAAPSLFTSVLFGPPV
jgi:hypothetical protein